MSIFYSLDKLVSYNALLNFVIAERGVGKTYASTKFCVHDFLKHDNEFVYLRRYKTELETAVPHFFDALVTNDEFVDHALESKGSTFTIDGRVAGYAVSLSTANILKSTSFAKVKTIVFDEFIIDKGNYHYLRNEIEQLLDIIETIGRLRDVRVIFLGNAISITNPYFAYFNLSLPYGSDFKTFKDGLIVVNYVTNSAYREKKRQSRFGRLIADTSYGRYAIDNEWLRDSKAFIRSKSGACKNYSVITISGCRYGVWRESGTGFWYISDDYDPNNPCVFAFSSDDHNETTILSNARRSSWFKPVIRAYREGTLAFENQRIKNNVLPILQKCLTY